MKDDKKDPDQQYQYPDEEYVVEGEAHRPDQGLPPPNVNTLLSDLWHANKRVIVITVIALFVALGLKLCTGKHKDAAPAVVSAPVQAAPPVVKDMNAGQLQSAMDAANQNKVAVTELHTELQQLQSSIDSINSAQAQFSNTLAALTEQVNQIQASLQPKKPVVKKVAPRLISYTLRAIIPGRAWIQGSNGSAKSIAVGDSLKQYGTVQTINPDAGTVTTTSGKVITFNNDDS